MDTNNEQFKSKLTKDYASIFIGIILVWGYIECHVPYESFAGQK
jgi:hypothetical protein